MTLTLKASSDSEPAHRQPEADLRACSLLTQRLRPLTARARR